MGLVDLTDLQGLFIFMNVNIVIFFLSVVSFFMMSSVIGFMFVWFGFAFKYISHFLRLLGFVSCLVTPYLPKDYKTSYTFLYLIL